MYMILTSKNAGILQIHQLDYNTAVDFLSMYPDATVEGFRNWEELVLHLEQLFPNNHDHGTGEWFREIESDIIDEIPICRCSYYNKDFPCW